MISKPVVNQVQYTEVEVAAQLRISVDELRAMIRRHIVVDPDDSGNVPLTPFQPSDLLVLRLLTKNGLPVENQIS